MTTADLHSADDEVVDRWLALAGPHPAPYAVDLGQGHRLGRGRCRFWGLGCGLARLGFRRRRIGIAKQLLELGFHGEARDHGIAVSVGLDQGPIRVERLSDNQARGLTACDDCLEELAEDRNPITVANVGHAGIVGERLVQVIAQIPAHTEPVGPDGLQLPC